MLQTDRLSRFHDSLRSGSYASLAEEGKPILLSAHDKNALELGGLGLPS